MKALQQSLGNLLCFQELLRALRREPESELRLQSELKAVLGWKSKAEARLRVWMTITLISLFKLTRCSISDGVVGES
ncbi:hypothetical protein EVAR_58025_1 [Eumeta japonica]|uniref:Uncharacterized protein n=1 Tax=Eumeta variegata TaxID=151549 RepID=A0A4C1ZII2_EUMVA|nr:hypothetical protein EVAR_58025_1 [Eumeta japonica]